MIDVPKLFIVRYKRNASEDDIKVDTKPKNIFNVFEDVDVDPASQLVARYNGSDEISQVQPFSKDLLATFITSLVQYFDLCKNPQFRI